MLQATPVQARPIGVADQLIAETIDMNRRAANVIRDLVAIFEWLPLADRSLTPPDSIDEYDAAALRAWYESTGVWTVGDAIRVVSALVAKNSQDAPEPSMAADDVALSYAHRSDLHAAVLAGDGGEAA